MATSFRAIWPRLAASSSCSRTRARSESTSRRKSTLPFWYWPRAKSTESWAAALQHLIEDPAYRQSLAEHAALAGQRYDLLERERNALAPFLSGG